MRTVYLGRQPIFNGDLKPVAYELLYRAGATNHSDRHDVRASANVLINAFLVTLDRLRAAGYGIGVDDLLVHEGTVPLLERAPCIDGPAAR